MGLRTDYFKTIQSLQARIDHHSEQWCCHKHILDWAMYTFYIAELIKIKLQILDHERAQGYNE